MQEIKAAHGYCNQLISPSLAQKTVLLQIILLLQFVLLFKSHPKSTESIQTKSCLAMRVNVELKNVMGSIFFESFPTASR